jgi:hypothetical protein
MKALHVGKSGRRRFTLPPDLVTETAAILARRGGGKTYTGNVMAEGFLDNGFQVVVIDPLNAWWGLRSSASGKSPGYPVVIFGGPRGDIPLEVGMAKGIADLVAENPGFSCVLSLRHMRKGKAKQFVSDFASQLFHRKGEEKLATAMHLFIDEAHRFAPQVVRADDANACGAIEDLVLCGRQAGIGVTMITQRSALLNKNVLTQAELLIVGQITGPKDKKAVREWIEENADDTEQGEFLSSLAKLQRGEFWFWSPAKLDVFARVDVRKRTTFDSSATPKTGKRLKPPKKVSAVDLEALHSKLQENLEAVKENDPKILKRRIAELEREARKKQPATVTVPAPTLDKAAVSKAVNDALDARDDEWRGSVDAFLKTLTDKTAEAMSRISAITLKTPARSKVGAPVVPTVQVRTPGPRIRKIEGEPAVTKPKIAILSVLVSRDGGPVTKKLIALQSGYSAKSGHFDNTLCTMRREGLIQGTGTISITPEGHQFFDRLGIEPTVCKLDYWINTAKATSKKCPKALLTTLRDHGGSMTKADLANASGYALGSGHFDNTLCKLRGLLIVHGSDVIAISDELM